MRDVFAAIKSKSYLSVNSTLSGSAVAPAPSTPPKEATPPPQEPEERRPSFGEEERGQSAGRKRTYNDRERDNGGRDDSPHGRGSPFSRGNKAPRRGALPTGRWSRGENTMNGRGNFRSPGQTHAQPHIEAHSPPFPAPATAIPGMPALGNISSIPNLPNSPPNLAAAMNAQIPPGFPPFDMAAMMAMASGWMPNQVPGQKTGVLDPSQRKRGQKCRDYIQQGFCMRGQMCPYDHGEDVITVPDYKAADEYDPNNAQLFGLEALQNGGGGRGNFNNNYRGRGSSRGGRGRGGRSEFSAVGPNADSRNSTIVVESIPEDKLNDADLQEYFSRFGEVKKITTQSYRRLAIIEFDKHDSARKAHSSPEPIFNNRFIKVFWYKNPDQDATSNKPLFQSSTLKAAGMIEGGEDEEMGGTGEPEFDMEEFQRKQEEAQKAHEAREAKRKAHEEAKKELEKKRIELLAKQAEQKLMMEKLALKKKMAAGKAGSSEPSTAGASTNGSGTPKADGEGKEAMTAALKAQLEKLEQEAASLGIDPNAAGADSTWEGASARGRGGFRGGYRGRGAYRGGYVPPYSARGGASFRGASRARAFAAKSLDNRPKRVAIRGISKDDHKGQEKIREILFVSSLPHPLTKHKLTNATVLLPRPSPHNRPPNPRLHHRHHLPRAPPSRALLHQEVRAFRLLPRRRLRVGSQRCPNSRRARSFGSGSCGEEESRGGGCCKLQWWRCGDGRYGNAGDARCGRNAVGEEG